MKKFISIMMAAVMMIGLPFSVNAAEGHNKEWSVNYDGKKMTTMVAMMIQIQTTNQMMMKILMTTKILKINFVQMGYNRVVIS